MKILLSPAKSLNTSAEYSSITPTVSSFLNDSEKLVKKLQKYSSKKLANLFHVSNEIADINYHRFQNWETPNKENLHNLPAVYAFSGEVYRGLNVTSLNLEQANYINSHVRILSGLYALLNPFDLIYPYRLEMGTKFPITPKVGSLYQFWGDKITKKLNEEESEFVINLASNEYFKAINTKVLKAKIITPVFKEFKNGEYKMLMTYAKNARGEMTRFCALNNIQNPEQLKEFDLSRYEFNDKMSSESEYVFVR